MLPASDAPALFHLKPGARCESRADFSERPQHPAAVARLLPRFVPLLLAALIVSLGTGCTRLEDHASLYRRSNGEWSLTWTVTAKRGINLVDSSGNVGSASASFTCRPYPTRELVWLVDGPALSWRGSGAAKDALGKPAAKGWRGTVTIEPNGSVHALTIDLRDIATGRPFVGNRRYENARGNGEMWFAN
jgi:hypothetical protein